MELKAFFDEMEFLLMKKPMLITFEPPKGLIKIIRKKPVMRLHIGKPIHPMSKTQNLE